MSVYLLLAVVAAVLWVMWRMFRWTFALIDYGRCRCRKGAVHPACPLHGWER